MPSSFRLTALVQITTSNISSNILFLFRLDTHTILSRAPIWFSDSITPSTILSHRYIWFQLNVLDGTKCILKHILFHLKRFRGTKCLRQWVLSHVKRFRGTKLKTPGPTSRQSSHSITTPWVSSTILQHHNLSFSASLVTLIILSHIPVRIIAGISLPRPSEKSSRDWNTPHPYTSPEADSRFSLRNVWLFGQSLHLKPRNPSIRLSRVCPYPILPQPTYRMRGA